VKVRPDAVDPEPAFGRGEEIAPGYRALALLQQGHDNETYDAWSDLRGARCVVKVLRPDKRESTSSRRQLLLEGRIATTLTHPHLVRGYEVLIEPHVAVVTETLSGATLRHLLGDGTNRLSASSLAHLGQQIGSALSYLHGAGFLHLDVKPGNIIVEGARARLIDLSLIQPPGPVSRGLGTAAYLSPEQGVGGEVGAAADVWGLGLTLYEAACGANPFGSRAEPMLEGGAEGTSAEAGCQTCGTPTVFLQTTLRAPSIRTVRRLPRSLADLVDAALAQVPEDRPTLADVRSTVAALLGSEEP
jgi:serine/threonine protein kinase